MSRSFKLIALIGALALFAAAPGLAQPGGESAGGTQAGAQLTDAEKRLLQDVPQSHWAYEAVSYLAERDVLEGYPDGSFEGEEPLSRYEFAVISSEVMKRLADSRSKSGEDMEVQVESVAERVVNEFAGDVRELARTNADKIEQLREDVDFLQEDLELTQEQQEENTTTLEQLAESVKINGYGDFEFEDGENSNGQFDLHRQVLQFYAAPNDKISWSSELEIEHGGVPEGVNVEQENGEIEAENEGKIIFEFANMDWHISDYFNLRGGTLLMPVGWTNMHHDSPERDFTARPLVDQRIIPTTWAENGAGFYGETQGERPLQYRAYITTGLTDNISNAGLGEAGSDLGGDFNNGKGLVLSGDWSATQELTVGGSWYRSSFTQSGDNLDLFDLHANYTEHPWEFTAQWVEASLDEVPAPSNGNGNGNSSASRLVSQNQNLRFPTEMSGGYIEGVYRFFPGGLKDTFLHQGEESEFALMSRWNTVDTSDLTSSDDTDRFEVGFNYRPNENLIYKLEWQFNDSDNPAFDEDRIWTSVNIGF